MDRCIPKIRFSTRNKEALVQSRVVVRIDHWPIDSRWPEVDGIWPTYSCILAD